jgi:hypothetical protein
MAKTKSLIDRFIDTVTTVAGEVANAAVMPSRDIEAEAVAAGTNEQMYMVDAGVAPRVLTPPPKRAKAKKPASKSTQPIKANKKAAKKAAPKTIAKTKKAAKKAAKKRATKKTKRL